MRWVALYQPLPGGDGRWFYNVALVDGIGCGQLPDTPTDAAPEVAMNDFRALLCEHFAVPDGFEFEPGQDSWGATFVRP